MFLLLLADVLYVKPFSCLPQLLITFYFVLKKNAQRSLALHFHLWFGQSQALCQLSRHTTAWLSSPYTAKAPPVLAQAPQFPLHSLYPLSCD